jgi:predicted transcriptional regulator
MYKLYFDGEETYSCENFNDMRDEIAELREDFIRDELQEREKHPEWYENEPHPIDSWTEYFCDVYEVYQVIDPTEVL